MPRDEATVDRIFAGNLDDLPPLSSKVKVVFGKRKIFPSRERLVEVISCHNIIQT